MPTFSYKIKDIEKLVGAKINNIEKYLEFLKIDYEIKGDEISLEFKDVNRPELWAIEILAREIKAKMGKKIKNYGIKKSNFTINVDKNIINIRPYIGAIIVEKVNINENFLKYLIQVQEALAENYGKKRKYISIGIYEFDKINWPVFYKAVFPEEIKFVPLDMEEELNLKQILKVHDKGIKYGYILENFDKYPILIDSKKNVLSFPPIINSNYSGKVEIGKKNLMVEVTALQENFLDHTLDIFARIFLERGFKVYSVQINHPNGKKYYPQFKNIEIEIEKKDIDTAFNFSLNNKQIKDLAKKFLANIELKEIKKRFPLAIEANKIKFIYPSYRYDIKGKDDVIEDLLIAYGYNKFKPEINKLELVTKAEEDKNHIIYKKISNIMISFAEEVLTNILINPFLFREMIKKKYKLVEVANPISQNYSALRNYIFPNLLYFLSLNKQVNLPIKIFEIGNVLRVINEKGEDIENNEENGKIKEEIHLAYAAIGNDITFTNAKQDLEFLFRNLNLNYELEEIKHDSFIEGRVAKIIVNNKEIGFIGEIHPAILNNLKLFYPTLIFEINLDELELI
ncbi:MAG: phenylalanine--tRNA ligase subunit beta [Candidatus Pacearchaeota archaeon]